MSLKWNRISLTTNGRLDHIITKMEVRVSLDKKKLEKAGYELIPMDYMKHFGHYFNEKIYCVILKRSDCSDFLF